jgi:Tfp pilus assembly protein PilF
MQILILDSCRNNPFADSRSTVGGWAAIPSTAGTLVIFGTGPGSTASDNKGERNGLFTKWLLSHISEPAPVENVLKEVIRDTINASAGAQTPWWVSCLNGDFSLNPNVDTGQIPVSVPSSSVSSKGETRGLTAGPALQGSDVGAADARSADILVSQGLQLAENGDYSEAIRSLSAALIKHPGYSVLLRVLGLILHFAGRTAEAAAQFSRAIDADPADPLAYMYSCVESTNSNPSQAITDCVRAVSINPRLGAGHLALANAYLAAGRPMDAFREDTIALSLMPDSPNGYILRARIHGALGKSADAEKDVAIAIRMQQQ